MVCAGHGLDLDDSFFPSGGCRCVEVVPYTDVPLPGTSVKDRTSFYKGPEPLTFRNHQERVVWESRIKSFINEQ